MIGTEDYSIKIYRGDTLITELVEVSVVDVLCGCDEYFAYGLKSGMVGVYKAGHRVWRMKTRHHVTALAWYCCC